MFEEVIKKFVLITLKKIQDGIHNKARITIDIDENGCLLNRIYIDEVNENEKDKIIN